MRELSAEEIAKKAPIYLTSAVQFPGKPPAPGITASVGRPASTGAGAAPGRPPAPAAECGQDKESFCATVKSIQDVRQLSRGAAIKAAVAENPGLHQKHIARLNAQEKAESHEWSFVTGEPVTFPEAVNKMLGLGHAPREAVRQAAARYPALYQQRQEKLRQLSKGHFFQE